MIVLLASALLAAAPPGPLDAPADAVAEALASLEPPLGVTVAGPPALADAFGAALGSRLASAKRSPVILPASSPEAAEQTARAQGLRSLARLELAVEGTELIVRGAAFSTWENFWSGRVPSRSPGALAIALRTAAPQPVLTLAGVPLPAVQPPLAAVDAGLPPTAPLELALEPWLSLPSRPAALGAGDLDGDGADEVAVLLDDAVWLVDAKGKLRAQAPLSTPRSPTPTREPFGVVAFAPGRLVVWSARRAQPEAFALQGGALRSLGVAEESQLPASPAPGLTSFEPKLRLWGKTYELPVGAQQLSATEGAALLTLADGSARFLRAAGLGAGKLGPIGSGSALVVFAAGQPTALVASTTRATGDGDTLRVLALTDAEAAAARSATLSELKPLWQTALPRGRAVVATSLKDAPGVGVVVLGLWHANDSGELVALRKVSP